MMVSAAQILMIWPATRSKLSPEALNNVISPINSNAVTSPIR